MKLKNILIVFIGLITSCTNSKKEFYPNGELQKEYSLSGKFYDGVYKEFYPNGNLKLIHQYNKGQNIDSSTYFYEDFKDKVKSIKYWGSLEQLNENFFQDGRKKSSGQSLNDKPIGVWRFYNKHEGYIEALKEYTIINNESYLNQSYYLSKNGDTLDQGTSFKLDFNKDTILINEPIKAVAYLKTPLFKDKNSEIIVCLPKGENITFKKDFSNDGAIELDTFYNLSKDSKNQKWAEGVNFKQTAIFGKWFNTPGNKIIRGYIIEYYEQPADSVDIIKEEHKKYFEKEIYVKDTIGKPDSVNS